MGAGNRRTNVFGIQLILPKLLNKMRQKFVNFEERFNSRGRNLNFSREISKTIENFFLNSSTSWISMGSEN